MNLCIYHGGCTDGVAAAWAVWKAGAADIFHPGVYQQDPPWDLIEAAPDEGRIIMVDFSYKRPVMEEIADRARTTDLLILDHHKTARDDLVPLLEAGRWEGVFDMDRCGALIAWDWFHGPERPALLEAIDAQDRWLPERDPALIMSLRSQPHAEADDIKWRELMMLWTSFMTPEGMASLQTDGRAIYRYYRARINETKPHASPMQIGDFKDVPVVNAPYCFASDVAGELAKDAPDGIAAVWWRNQDGSATFSLRSRGDVDVGVLATEFGGGGHPGAAGFRVSRDALSDMALHDSIA